MSDTKAGPGHNSGDAPDAYNVTADELRQMIEQIETLEGEKKDIADRILTTWAEVAGKARHHLPGGQILPEDRPGLYKRVASICGATVEAVKQAVEAAHG